MTDGGPRRVRVTADPRRLPASRSQPVRSVAAGTSADAADDADAVYSRALRRTQLRLALGTVAGFVVVAVALTIVIAGIPELDRHDLRQERQALAAAPARARAALDLGEGSDARLVDEAAQLAGRDVRAVTDDVLVGEVRGVDDRCVRVDDGGFRIELGTQRCEAAEARRWRGGSCHDSYALAVIHGLAWDF